MATTPSAVLRLSLEISEVWGTGPTRQAKRSNILGANRPLVVRMPNGTAAGKVDKVLFKRPTIGAGATFVVDLAGTLTDEEGNTITLAKLKGIGVFNFDTDSTLTLQAPASNAVSGFMLAASDGITVPSARSTDEPGFVYVHAPNGVTVTAGTGDRLEIVNNDGSNAANCYLAFYGTSA